MLKSNPYYSHQHQRERDENPIQRPKNWHFGTQPFLLGFFRNSFFIIFFIAFFISCKKEKSPSTPGVITGRKNLCPGETGVIFSIDPVEFSTYYLWTVPDDAKIISGQGTTTVIINFGKKSGSICVRSNNENEVGGASCMELTQGGVSNSWCREMDLTAGVRTEAVGFSIGNKGYIGTGVDAAAVQHRDFWEYDSGLNEWTQKADFGGGPRFDATGFSIGNKGYIGTGYIGTAYLKDFWEYNPQTNQWLQKADCGTVPRGFAFGFSIGNKGYIGSGSDDFFSTRTDFLEYDPIVDQWTEKANVVPRNVAVGFSIGNKGYLGVGTDGSTNYNDFWEFDPLDTSNGLDLNNNPLGKWNQKASFPGAPRYGAVGFSISNKGYIGTGADGNFYYQDFYEFDPVSNSWVQKVDFAGESRGYGIGFSIGNNGYIGTGNKIDGPFSDFFVFGQ
jgi:N-acetylneuraminic acid mutarotase